MESEAVMADKDNIIYIKPNKAYRKIKTADEDNITVYIYGVTGIGKTELIKRYLKGREYFYFDAGTLYAQELDIQGRIVVIDNLHELTVDNGNEEVKKIITSLIERDDVWVILAGRSDVPPWLTAVRYREVFCCIEQAELLWDEQEVLRYLNRTQMVYTDSQKKILKESCLGMPIAWNITYHDYIQERINDDSSQLKQPLCDERFQAMLQKGFSRMWDYLEYHVYDCWDIELQEFLLEISIVDSFNVHLAEMITGRNDVEQLIDRAKWIGNFVSETINADEVIYRLMDAVRTSMHRRLYRRCSKEKIRTIYENAGLYYQLNLKYLDALRMYETVGDMERIMSILIDNVRKSVNTSHYYELKKYYLELSDDRIRKSPELMCGMSMLRAMLLDIEESERWYGELAEYAMTHTGSERKLAMSRILYLDMDLPHRGTADMGDVLKRAYKLILDKQIFLGEFVPAGNQPSLMNGGKDFCEWSKNDRESADRMKKIFDVVLGRYAKGLISTALAESTFEKGGDNYEVAVLANKGRMQAEAGGSMQVCFVADGILSWLHIITGKASEAVELLERFYRKVEINGYKEMFDNVRTFAARCALYMGDNKNILKWMETAPDEEQGFLIYNHFEYLTKIRVYMQLGKNEQAYNLIAKCDYYAQVMNRTYISIELKLLKAIIEYRTDNKRWIEDFSGALSKACEYNFVRIVTREGAAVKPLLEEYLKADKTSSLSDAMRYDNICKDGKNRCYMAQIADEADTMAKFYPCYLKVNDDNVVLNDTAVSILRLLAKGMSKEKIACELGMSTANVKYHTQQVYRKLGVSNKTEAVMEAGRRGLI